jgi:tagatose 6-phosphate kinase
LAGVAHELVQIEAASRRTVTIVAEEATGFYEPGPTISPDEWETFVARYESVLGRADAVALCGSIPPGAPPDAYATLSTLAHRAGVPVAVDADGTTLSEALAGRPELVKVNTEELARATGEREPQVGAEQLRAGGAGAVVVTEGADGLSAFCPEGRFRARPPERVAGNPTGAGDAAMAMLVLGLARGQSWPDQLASAAALSAATVRATVAGDFDREMFARWRERIQIARNA